jgi:hypothetical protein
MSTVKTTEIYSFESKKKLKERIEKLTEKENIEKIKQLIFKNNKNLSFTQNSSGILLFFHNLTDDTYNKIDFFLKKLDNKKVKQITSTYTEEDDTFTPDITESYTNNIRLSSLEKNIIKKKDYYEKLKEENNVDIDVIYKSDDDDLEILTKVVPNKNVKKSKKTK